MDHVIYMSLKAYYGNKKQTETNKNTDKITKDTQIKKKDAKTILSVKLSDYY